MIVKLGLLVELMVFVGLDVLLDRLRRMGLVFLSASRTKFSM